MSTMLYKGSLQTTWVSAKFGILRWCAYRYNGDPSPGFNLSYFSGWLDNILFTSLLSAWVCFTIPFRLTASVVRDCINTWSIAFMRWALSQKLAQAIITTQTYSAAAILIQVQEGKELISGHIAGALYSALCRRRFGEPANLRSALSRLWSCWAVYQVTTWANHAIVQLTTNSRYALV